jgi:hypothetical protein
MVSRRLVAGCSIVATAVSCYTLGVMQSRRHDAVIRASYDAKLEAIRAEVHAQADAKPPTSAVVPASTRAPREGDGMTGASRARMVAEIKEQLQSEMGLLPVTLLRDRRSSFVELYSSDNLGKTNYGTAGYLGNGYFITVKHAVVALRDDDERAASRRITSVKVMYRGKESPAKVVDTGDADVEVHTATGRSSRRGISICRRCTSILRSPTSSPSRSSASATTTRRASSSRPAMSASTPRTGW